MGRRKKRWTYTAGQRPNRVTVFERESEGTLYAKCWDQGMAGARGGMRKASLGHRDKARAKAYAHEQAAKLEQGGSSLATGKADLDLVLNLYRQERSPDKSVTERTADERRIALWRTVLGPDRDPHTVSLRDWDSFIRARRSGAIDARGNQVPAKSRRPVGDRTVEADLKWLKWVFNWACRWMNSSRHYLMRENPVRGFPAPSEKNPRRPVASQDRFEAIRSVSDQVPTEETWHGERKRGRCYLSELLDLANGTGRRISAICQLTYADLQLDRGPYGSIEWPAETDKGGRRSLVPVSPEVRRALDRILRERPAVGVAPLFPSPRDRAKPIDRYLASKWLRKAEQLAGLEPQKGSLWHAFRRKWATERKHLPVVDVAEAGGWSTAATVQQIYQRADEQTMLEVVLGAGKLRENLR